MDKSEGLMPVRSTRLLAPLPVILRLLPFLHSRVRSASLVQGDSVKPSSGNALFHPIYPGAMRLQIRAAVTVFWGIHSIAVQFQWVAPSHALRGVCGRLTHENDRSLFLPEHQTTCEPAVVEFSGPDIEVIRRMRGKARRPIPQVSLNPWRDEVLRDDMHDGIGGLMH